MIVYINAKSIGKRKGYMEQVPYELESGIDTVQTLIESIVSIEVRNFMDRQNKTFLGFLNEEDINDQIHAGKVSYGTVYNTKQIDVKQAQEIAVEAFIDGIVMLLINDQQLSDVHERIDLKPNDQITFIRLTFLTGRLW